MKRELAITGIALVVSILLSSPSLAQTTLAKADAAPSPGRAAAAETSGYPALEEMPLDEAILFASTPEDRVRLIMRCAGPPPRPAMEIAMSPVRDQPVASVSR